MLNQQPIKELELEKLSGEVRLAQILRINAKHVAAILKTRPHFLNRTNWRRLRISLRACPCWMARIPTYTECLEQFIKSKKSMNPLSSITMRRCA